MLAEPVPDDVAIAGAMLVDEQDLRSQHLTARVDIDRAVAGHRPHGRFAAQALDDHRRDVSSTIASAVDHQGLLVELRVVELGEFIEPRNPHVGHVHVPDLASAGLLDLLDVAQDPIEVIERLLVRRGDHRLVPGPFVLGLAVHPQDHRLAGRAHQGRIEVGHAPGRLALDRQDVVARPDLDTDLRQRAAVLRVPVVSAQDALDAEVTAGVGPDHRPEQSERNALGLRQIAAAHVGMPDVELTDHLPDEVGQVGAMPDMLEQRLIPTAHAGPVHPVQLRVEEEVAHLAPAFGMDLAPLGLAIQADLQIGQAQLAIGEVQLGRRQVQDGEVATSLDEHLLVVGRHPVAGHLPQLRFLLLLQVEHMQLALLEIEELVAHRGQGPVIRGCGRQHGDALGQPLGIDRHHDLGRLGGLGLVFALLRCGPGLAVVATARRLLLARFHLVGFRRERRFCRGGEGHEMDALHVAVGMVPLRLAIGRVERALRDEEEVLAVAAEFRRAHVEPSVGDLHLVPLGQPVEVDVGETAHLGLGEGQPLAVGRPGEIADLEGVGLGREGHAARFHLDELEPVEPVGPGDALGIGRPGQLVLVGTAARSQGTRLARAVLRPDPDLVFAALVADVGDPFPVGRPDRVPLMHPGRLRQVAGRAVLGRHGEHIAPRAQQGPRAIGCDLVGGGLLADIAQAPTADGQVLANLHRDAGDLLGLEVQAIQVPPVLEDNARVAQGGELDGEFLEIGQPSRFPVLQVHHIQVGLPGLLALRDEVDPVTMPHRKQVLGGIGGQAGGLTGSEVVQPEFVGLAAAVALPGAELAEDAVVDHLPAIGREAAPTTARHGQRLRHAAREPGQGQITLEGIPLVAARAVDDRLVVLPGHDDVVRAHAVRDIVALQGRGVGEAFRFAPLGGHHIHLGVAVVLAGEGERFAVRRKTGEHLESLGVGCQPAGHPALHRHGVQVSRIREDHPVPVQCREPQQPRLFGLNRQRNQTSQAPRAQP